MTRNPFKSSPLGGNISIKKRHPIKPRIGKIINISEEYDKELQRRTNEADASSKLKK